MGERSIPELSSEARELLGAFRVDESPTASARAEHWKGVQRRISAAPEGASASAAGQGLYYAKIVAATMTLAAGVLLAVKGVGMGVTALSSSSPPPAMEAPYQGAAESEGGQAVERAHEAHAPRRGRATRSPTATTAPAEPGDASSIVPEPEPESAAEVEEVEPDPTRARSRTRPSPEPSSPAAASSAASDLMAELALIKEATRAKDSGRTKAGLDALRRHAQQFPSGTLADERRVLRAELLCAAGRHDEARAEMRSFLKARSGSALSGRMRGACPGGE